ncbi:hypothetical protein HD806DRAFT_544285 [Xylariaceae sp. AK1471]|nr:hypothetical protein HD806DRAFT_544285 [Xylariaceae sp. AK1471]
MIRKLLACIDEGPPTFSFDLLASHLFTIPDAIAAGDYVFAWTWISKLSGTQEYYMNCAPVTITGGSGKRDVAQNETLELFSRDTEFPELMVSNLGEINDCKSQLSTDPQYPNPGSNVLKPGSNNNFAPISGTNCVPKGAKDVSPSGGSGSGSSSGSPSSSAPAQIATSTAGSQSSGFVTSTITPTSSSGATTTSSAANSSSATISSTAAQSPSTYPSPSSGAPASGPSGSPSSGSGVKGLTGACSAEGMFNCIDGSSYQQCASGSWSVVMAMPPTTKCAEGQTMTLWGRDQSADRKKSAFQGRRRGY